MVTVSGVSSTAFVCIPSHGKKPGFAERGQVSQPVGLFLPLLSENDNHSTAAQRPFLPEWPPRHLTAEHNDVMDCRRSLMPGKDLGSNARNYKHLSDCILIWNGQTYLSVSFAA
jgi:hypothetical protein